MRHRREKLTLCRVGFFSLASRGALAFHELAHIELPLPRPLCRADDSCERRYTDRPLEQRHISLDGYTTQRSRQRVGQLTISGQQHDRYIGPRRLTVQRLEQL